MLIATACADSSTAPESQGYFAELETVYQAYDARLDEIRGEFNPQLPLATSVADVDDIRKERLREILAAFVEFEDGLAGLTPLPSLLSEHQALLDHATALNVAYREDLRLLETGKASDNSTERAEERKDVYQAVDALISTCQGLQEIAESEGAGVMLACK